MNHALMLDGAHVCRALRVALEWNGYRRKLLQRVDGQEWWSAVLRMMMPAMGMVLLVVGGVVVLLPALPWLCLAPLVSLLGSPSSSGFGWNGWSWCGGNVVGVVKG